MRKGYDIYKSAHTFETSNCLKSVDKMFISERTVDEDQG